MRILVTNDDGINAPGLAVLERIAAEIAGEGGEVWCVAPAFEQSGVAHCISYTHPTMIAELAPRRFAAEGSPADCVLAGIFDVLGGEKPDLVLSGVNRGNNSAENAVYSGTLGGAMEGALHGIPAIALSQYLGAGTKDLDDPFEASAVHGAGVVRKLLAADQWRLGEEGGYTTFYNVNFPPCAASEVAGTRAAIQGRRPGDGFGMDASVSPGGRRFLWVRGARQDVDSGPGTDATLNRENYITVTPMRADLTAHDAVEPLSAALK
ncbi:5'/3'-nucleotidase SurE [Tropicimonas sp. IMCC34011]|uniref:5'/3'-nucleotidase SurE n=1 Tax=Tropicimonas sp. IMCC34011 TaxID=2248759 RepID=UPI000E238EB2|nr:5'/3'-nucleotidase SurE [Tropicimonas sp. IMCC34011]